MLIILQRNICIILDTEQEHLQIRNNEELVSDIFSHLDLKTLPFTILSTNFIFLRYKNVKNKKPNVEIYNFYLDVVRLKDKPTQRGSLHIKKDFITSVLLLCIKFNSLERPLVIIQFKLLFYGQRSFVPENENKCTKVTELGSWRTKPGPQFSFHHNTAILPIKFVSMDNQSVAVFCL